MDNVMFSMQPCGLMQLARSETFLKARLFNSVFKASSGNSPGWSCIFTGRWSMLEGLQMCENEPNFDNNIFTPKKKRAGVDDAYPLVWKPEESTESPRSSLEHGVVLSGRAVRVYIQSRQCATSAAPV